MDARQRAHVVCVGITGPSCSGKTSLARALSREIPHSTVLCQDDFFKPLDKVPGAGLINWEALSSVDMVAFESALRQHRESPHQHCNTCMHQSIVPPKALPHVVIAEGLHLHDLWSVCLHLHVLVLLEGDRGLCESRRREREYEGLPDPPDYFDEYVWPAYVDAREAIQHLATKGTPRVVNLEANDTVREWTTRVLTVLDQEVKRKLL